MLESLEKAVLDRLGDLKRILPRLELRDYAGELGDGQLLAEVARSGHAVLIATTQGRFDRRSARRYHFLGTVKLYIFVRQARGESASRLGVRDSLGSYALWESCMRLLTDFAPMADAKQLQPAAYRNEANGRLQDDYLSVVSQTFDLTCEWTIPDDPAEPLAGIDLSFFVPPGAAQPVAVDHLTLEKP